MVTIASVLFLTISLLLLLLGETSANNAASANVYPVVLLHGVFGWGRDEMFNMPYWGAFSGDIHRDLQKHNYKVFTAAVGPVSSNHDRACELYAQIKGGRVDYGESHAAKYGHSRYGRTFKGLYPEWGTIDPQTGLRRKLHFIGHSMGGQTIRLVAHYLNHGNTDENYDGRSELFSGNKADWIFSITSVGTPHGGSTLVDSIISWKIGSVAKKAVGVLGGLAGIIGPRVTSLYDFKLDQWGLQFRRKNQGLRQYLRYLFDSSFFTDNYEDSCLHDLSTKGASELNNLTATNSTENPDIFYFSYTTADTRTARSWFSDVETQVPNFWSMNFFLHPSSRIIGSTGTLDLGLTKAWMKNDGMVNSVSGFSPSLEVVMSHEDSVSFKGSAVAGKWQHLATLPMDHLNVVGWAFSSRSFLYVGHMKALRVLEDATAKNSSVVFPDDVASDLIDEIDAVKASKPDSFDSLERKCDHLSTPAQLKYCEMMVESKRPAWYERQEFYFPAIGVAVLLSAVCVIIIYRRNKAAAAKNSAQVPVVVSPDTSAL